MHNLRMGHPGFTLMSHLFRQFADETGRSTAGVEQSKVSEFYNWAQSRKEENHYLDYPLFPDHEDIQEAYGIPGNLIRSVSRIFDDPFTACQQLYTWWPMLCLSPRKPLKTKPVAISLSASVQFDDGTIAHVPYTVGKQLEPYTDGMLLTVLRAQSQVVSALLQNTGADMLHAQVQTGQKIVPVPINPDKGALGF